MLYKFVVSFSSVATSVDCYVRLCSPSDAMRPPTIQSLELEVERMKVCLVRDCHSVCMSGGVCDNAIYTMDSHYNPGPSKSFQSQNDLVCKRHAYFQVVKDDN